VLLFAIAPELRVESLPPFAPDSETSGRGVVLGPGGLDEVFAFSRHIEAAKRYFDERGIDRPHGYRDV
jgi:hypothetical protein